MIKTQRNSVMFLFVAEHISSEFKLQVCNYFDLDQEQTFFITTNDLSNDNIKKINPKLVVFYECKPSSNISTDFVVYNKENVDDVKNKVEKLALTDFPHLHLHDEFSLRDGIGTAKQRVEFLVEKHQTYITSSNHGSIGGWIKQYVLAKKHGMKAVFGIEAYLNRYRKFTKEEAKLFDDEMKLKYRKNNHFLLLTRTEEGWFNIIKIHNDAHQNGFYYVPRTYDDFLATHGKGIIATSCDGGAGEIPQILMNQALTWQERCDQARAKYLFYKDIFDDFYIELNLLDWDEMTNINRALITFGEWVGAKYAITCDCHYIRPEDSKTHDVLLMLRDKKTMVDKALAYASGELGRLLVKNNVEETNDELTRLALEFGRVFLTDGNYIEALKEYEQKVKSIAANDLKFDQSNEDSVWEFNAKDLYMKDFNEIHATWQRLHGHNDTVFTEDIFYRAARNTRQLVRSIQNFDIDTSFKLPKIADDSDEALRQLCFQGLKKKKLHNDTYVKRLNFELDLISKNRFSDYFLVFYKIVEFCQQHEITIGCGRGSAAGSLISYCLEITQVDPIKYNLLFERFMDEGRSSVHACSFEV